MNIKNKKFAFQLNSRQAGFTLIELMIASAIAAVVLVISFILIGNVYFARKQIRVAQNFYSEARFLLEKIVTISRENTIDYDRYFEKVGPNQSSCSSFDPDQIVFAKTKNNSINTNNDSTNRKILNYPDIFYWKISDDLYRNLGGMKPDGSVDPCAQAFHGTPTTLFLINKERNIRTAIKLVGNRIQTSVELGADTDHDGEADLWSYNSEWDNVNGKCSIPDESNAQKETLIQDEELCNQAHDFTNISAKNLQVSSFNFTPYPDRDPYLNFRVEEDTINNEQVQVHPNVFLYMKVDLANFADFGFENQPTITMQTSVSSRVYGNNRK